MVEFTQAPETRLPLAPRLQVQSPHADLSHRSLSREKPEFEQGCASRSFPDAENSLVPRQERENAKISLSKLDELSIGNSLKQA